MSALLEIKNLHVSVADTEILKGLSLSVSASEVHAIMGPNGSGKSTLSYVLAGRDGYEITEGDILLNGVSLKDMNPEDRAIAGLFLAFQYPLEIPGVTNMTFLKTSVNAVRRGRGEEEMDAASFLRFVRDKAKALRLDDDMLKRPLNVGFSGGEKKRNEILQNFIPLFLSARKTNIEGPFQHVIIKTQRFRFIADKAQEARRIHFLFATPAPHCVHRGFEESHICNARNFKRILKSEK